MKAVFFVAGLMLATPGDTPAPVQVDGRTWVWDATLGFHRPAGSDWHYDVDRQTFWRATEPKQPDRPARIHKHDWWWRWDGTRYVPEGEHWHLEGGYWVWREPVPVHYHSPVMQLRGGYMGRAGGVCAGGT